jgi:hypothetical protein
MMNALWGRAKVWPLRGAGQARSAGILYGPERALIMQSDGICFFKLLIMSILEIIKIKNNAHFIRFFQAMLRCTFLRCFPSNYGSVTR